MGTAAAILVGAGIQGISAVSRANAAQRTAMALAGQDETNAELADRAGADAIARGGAAAQKVNLRTGNQVAEGTQQFATSGVSTTSGSPVAVLADERMMGSLDAITTKNNALREAMGYAAQGVNFRTSARYAEMGELDQANAALVGGVAGAARSTIPLLRIGKKSDSIPNLDSYGQGNDIDEAD